MDGHVRNIEKRNILGEREKYRDWNLSAGKKLKNSRSVRCLQYK